MKTFTRYLFILAGGLLGVCSIYTVQATSGATTPQDQRGYNPVGVPESGHLSLRDCQRVYPCHQQLVRRPISAVTVSQRTGGL